MSSICFVSHLKLNPSDVPVGINGITVRCEKWKSLVCFLSLSHFCCAVFLYYSICLMLSMITALRLVYWFWFKFLSWLAINLMYLINNLVNLEDCIQLKNLEHKEELQTTSVLNVKCVICVPLNVNAIIIIIIIFLHLYIYNISRKIFLSCIGQIVR